MGRHRRPGRSPKAPQLDRLVQSSRDGNVRPLRSGIVCDQVSVDYGHFRLGPLSLKFATANLSCLVGPNGSGKTSLVRALMGTVKLATGQVRYDELAMSSRPPDVLRLIGFVPDGPENLLPELTAQEFWELHALAHARIMGGFDQMMARAAQFARILDLAPSRATIRSYSHGMQKKTQLIAGLIHQPDYLILDEPRNGLDPISGETVDRLIADECRRGATVVMATHDLRYAARIAEFVVVFNNGQCAAAGSPDRLRCPDDRDFVDTFFRLVQGNGAHG